MHEWLTDWPSESDSEGTKKWITWKRELHVHAVALQVCLLVIAQGYLGIAMKISATMMKRGHLKETAKVSRYLVAAGHSDFRKCLDGEAFQL